TNLTIISYLFRTQNDYLVSRLNAIFISLTVPKNVYHYRGQFYKLLITMAYHENNLVRIRKNLFIYHSFQDTDITFDDERTTAGVQQSLPTTEAHLIDDNLDIVDEL